jgi:Outer membrane protein and related peptidoglycan-associated (lipo)proteins
MKKNGYLTITFMVIAALAGCSSTPNAHLDSARSSYRSAQSDPKVTNLAPLELKQAGDTLAEADNAWKKGKDSAEVDHLADMAQKQVAIAQETAKRKAAEADVSAADAERNKIRLSARTEEAEKAQQQAQSAEMHAQSAEMRASALESQLKELNAKKSDRGMVITLGDVLFDIDRAQLKSGGVREVQKLADILKQNPQRNVAIEGFTDSTGSESHNQELSERRANAVRDTLMNMGIDSSRITTRGYGKSFPVASNSNEAGRQLNRRVEVIISDESGNIRSR